MNGSTVGCKLNEFCIKVSALTRKFINRIHKTIQNITKLRKYLYDDAYFQILTKVRNEIQPKVIQMVIRTNTSWMLIMFPKASS